MNSIYRNLFAFLSLYLLPSVGYGQHVFAAIENSREQHTVYAKAPNQLSIAVQGFSGKYLVETDNGKIEKDPDENGYTWYPEHDGYSSLIIRKAKATKDTLWAERYKVVALPPPFPLFANKKGGTLKAAEARVQIAPAAIVFGGGAYGCASFKITEFTLTVIRDGKTLFNKKIRGGKGGARFTADDDAEQIVSTLMPLDILLFNNIKAVGGGLDQEFELSPMIFTLTN
jgi:hypothetical protein